MLNSHLKNKLIRAYYEIRPDITVYCLLRVLSVTEDGQSMTVTVGLRALDDASLPAGTRLTIKALEMGELDQRKQYLGRVERIEKQGGLNAHVIQLLEVETPQYNRQHPRLPLEIEAHRSDDITFTTSNISMGGLQFQYSATLTSIMVDQPMRLTLKIHGQNVPFECNPRYIRYNWWDQRHTVGAAFMNVTPQQTLILETLLASLAPLDSALPEAERLVSEAADMPDESLPEIKDTESPLVAATGPEGEQEAKIRKTLIDPETGRIRTER